MSGPGRDDPQPLRLAPGLAGQVQAGLMWASPVSVGPASEALQAAISDYASGLRTRLGGQRPSEIDGLAPARELYRWFGIDPTKLRPSSEALLRRVLRDRPLPQILNAVDLGNLVALRSLLPLGLYDASKIDGHVVLRRGKEGEEYRGVRKDEVHLTRRPVLVDRLGPFGNPTADSLRTCVDESTTSLWMVVFAPASFATEQLERHLVAAAADSARFLAAPGGEVETATAVVR